MLPKRGRRDAAPRKPHTVTPKENFFEVLSGNSGTVYRVVPDGDKAICACEGFRNRQACSHVTAVLEYAKAALEGKQ